MIKNERMVIHAKEVMMLTGVSERTAQRLLVKIRKQNSLLPRSLVSIELFALFTGLKEEKIREILF